MCIELWYNIPLIKYLLFRLDRGFRALDFWPEKLPRGTRSSDYMAFDIVAGLSLGKSVIVN